MLKNQDVSWNALLLDVCFNKIQTQDFRNISGGISLTEFMIIGETGSIDEVRLKFGQSLD